MTRFFQRNRRGATWPRIRELRQQWSPEQIAGWLRTTFPDDERMQISHETIYRSLFVQARGVLKKELAAHLRTRRVMTLPSVDFRPGDRANAPTSV
jgi:IS30 family transposase